MTTKQITYNKLDRDWTITVDGVLIGIAANRLAAEQMANAAVYDRLSRQSHASVSALDEDAATLLSAEEDRDGVNYFEVLDRMRDSAPHEVDVAVSFLRRRLAAR